MVSNKTYDILKLAALIVAPVTVFVAAIMSAWGLPYAEQITATLAALDTLLGALVEIFRRAYVKEIEAANEAERIAREAGTWEE